MRVAIMSLDRIPSANDLVRVWAHEGLRLFHDRLIEENERVWCHRTLDEVAAAHFYDLDLDSASASTRNAQNRGNKGTDNERGSYFSKDSNSLQPQSRAAIFRSTVLRRPLLYSTWFGKCYQPVERNVLQFYIAQRLKTFNEEELDMKLVLFDEMLEHILRIDCVLRKPMGHLLLIGESGTGKTALSRFVSWLNSISVFQIKPTRRYNVANFDDDLRCIMRRAGVNGERICFVSFDEFYLRVHKSQYSQHLLLSIYQFYLKAI